MYLSRSSWRPRSKAGPNNYGRRTISQWDRPNRVFFTNRTACLSVCLSVYFPLPKVSRLGLLWDAGGCGAGEGNFGVRRRQTHKVRSIIMGKRFFFPNFANFANCASFFFFFFLTGHFSPESEDSVSVPDFLLR